MTVVPENSLDMFKTERSSHCLKVETPQSKNHITSERVNQTSVLKTCAIMLYLVQKTNLNAVYHFAFYKTSLLYS